MEDQLLGAPAVHHDELEVGPTMTRIVGIDLGTTNSLVAITRPGGSPSVVLNADGSNLTPSVVLFEQDQTLVGGIAKNAAKTSPDNYVQFVKRQMGDAHWRFVDTWDREYRPEEISALILRKLIQDAAMALGEEVADAVITVPAYFDDVRRKATRDAGLIAGLTVHRLVNEPTAAAIAFGLDAQAKGTIFVFDLGGGTFDVTVMRSTGTEFEVIATDGDRNLGGYDFDNALMRHAAQRIQADGGPDVLDDIKLEYDLREQCERVKHRLSTMDKATIYLQVGARSFEIDVTRSEFEALTRDLLERTEVLAEGVLDDAHVRWSDVDHLLLVGGSTRMPMVRAMIERVSGKKPVVGVNPDEAVALGAAIVATAAQAKNEGGGLPAPVSFNDITSMSMGVVAVDEDRNFLRYNSIIIERNHPVPADEARVYQTLDHHQREIEIEVTEGNEEDMLHVKILGKQTLALPPGLPKYSPIKIIMKYSIDQFILIEAWDLTNNKRLGEPFELEHPNLLKRSEVAALRESVALRTIQ
jgi:molecular chaperone DnaK